MPGLDGVRGFALLMVIGYHLGVFPGAVALIFFFVLSGFIITWLLLEEERRNGRVSLGAFYGRRTLRIFPAYYLALLCVVVLVPPQRGGLRADHAVSAALYWSNYYQALHGSVHGALSHYWSLGIEEQFYLLWPLTFIAMRRRLRAPLLAVGIGIVWWWRWQVYAVQGDLQWAYHALDCRADHVLIGCLLAVLVHGGHLAWLWRVLSTRLAYVVTVAVLFWSAIMEAKYGMDWRIRVAFYVQPVATAALLLQLMANHDKLGVSWWSSRLFTWLGDISYGTYLWHMFAIELVDRFGSDLPLAGRIAAVFALALAFGAASRYLVEAPFLKLKTRLNRLPPTQAPSSPEAVPPEAERTQGKPG